MNALVALAVVALATSAVGAPPSRSSPGHSGRPRPVHGATGRSAVAKKPSSDDDAPGNWAGQPKAADGVSRGLFSVSLLQKLGSGPRTPSRLLSSHFLGSDNKRAVFDEIYRPEDASGSRANPVPARFGTPGSNRIPAMSRPDRFPTQNYVRNKNPDFVQLLDDLWTVGPLIGRPVGQAVGQLETEDGTAERFPSKLRLSSSRDADYIRKAIRALLESPSRGDTRKRKPSGGGSNCSQKAELPGAQFEDDQDDLGLGALDRSSPAGESAVVNDEPSFGRWGNFDSLSQYSGKDYYTESREPPDLATDDRGDTWGAVYDGKATDYDGFGSVNQNVPVDPFGTQSEPERLVEDNASFVLGFVPGGAIVQNGRFEDDQGRCAGVTSRRCSVNAECSCLGLYFCVDQLCRSLSSSSSPDADSPGSVDGVWHQGPAEVPETLFEGGR